MAFTLDSWTSLNLTCGVEDLQLLPKYPSALDLGYLAYNPSICPNYPKTAKNQTSHDILA